MARLMNSATSSQSNTLTTRIGFAGYGGTNNKMKNTFLDDYWKTLKWVTKPALAVIAAVVIIMGPFIALLSASENAEGHVEGPLVYVAILWFVLMFVLVAAAAMTFIQRSMD